MSPQNDVAAEPLKNDGESATRDKRKRKREKEKANRQLAERTKSVKPAQEEPSKRRKSDSKKATTFKRPEPKPPAKPEKLNETIAQMDPNLTADYIGQRLRRFEKDLSAVELEDRFIPSRAFLDTTEYGEPRTLANLPAYLEKFSHVHGSGKGLDKASSTPGSPHTLVITAAAVRATDLARAVKKFQTKEAMVAKLFAKHIRMNESVEQCNNTKIGIGVGTPSRILALIRDGALKLDDLSTMVLDMSAVNEKQQGIFDIRETQGDVLDLLNEPVIKTKLGDKIKLLVY